MNRAAEERFEDILVATDRSLAYHPYLNASDEQLAAMAYDAVLRNLAVIGEAVRALPEATTAAMPDVAWAVPAVSSFDWVGRRHVWMTRSAATTRRRA